GCDQPEPAARAGCVEGHHGRLRGVAGPRAHRKSLAQRLAHPVTESLPDRIAVGVALAIADTEAHTVSDADAHTDAHADASSHAVADSGAHADAHTCADGDPQTHSVTDPRPTHCGRI